MQWAKNVAIGIAGILVLCFFLWAFSEDDKKAQEQADSSQHQSTTSQETKYQNERVKALSVVQVYKTNHIINQGTKYAINEGTPLEQVFKKQKEFQLIREDSRWLTFKDGSRFVVMYHGDFSGIKDARSSNNPQWAVLPQNDLETFSDAKIYALNGTAKTYTPELGEVTIQETSQAVKFYQRWESLMEKDKWNESRNQANLEVVAKEFGVSSEEADVLFSQGQRERDNQGKAQIDERGDVLSDEKIIQLLQEQGDF
ncbi:MAG: hypothetical protein E6P95_01760 [Candidatus Moraniibacteriota bacterium]|nr:MAG: hypothetical protein E6P95_01760 [Candidatus Moranbacteria bacterium]